MACVFAFGAVSFLPSSDIICMYLINKFLILDIFYVDDFFYCHFIVAEV